MIQRNFQAGVFSLLAFWIHIFHLLGAIDFRGDFFESDAKAKDDETNI